MNKYTFEMVIHVTEQTIVEAKSLEDAEKMVYNGDCEWEESKSQEGGEIYLVGEEVSSE